MTNRSVTFRASQEHAVAATRLIVRQRTKFPIWPVLVLGIPAGVLGIMMGAEGMFGIALPIMAALVLILCVIVAVVHYWMIPRQARRSFQQTRLLQQETRFSWDDEGFSLECDNARSRLGWGDLHAWGETDGLIVLMQSELLYNLVPVSAFEADQEADLRRSLERSGLKRL